MTQAFVHDTAVVDEGARIGEGTKIWHFSHVLTDTEVGQDCNIGQNVVVGPNVTVGNKCKIQNNVSVYKGVILEDEVFCGPSMVFTNVFNPRSAIRRMDEIRPTIVKKGASIGANATIICGITIGRYAFVGAGAVVTKDVPDYALVMGNPARQSGWMCECGEKLNSQMTCHVCGKSYPHLEGGREIAFVDLAAQQRKILPEIEANIRKVLQHGKYIMGPEVGELEEQLAEIAGVRHAVSCSSGTDALIMALMAYGIGPGDAVITSPFTFIATAEAVRLLGATPVFAEVDPVTFNLDPRKLLEAVEQTRQDGRGLVPKAVIPVDLFGLPCDYDRINRIAEEKSLVVIEDAAQSFGGLYKGRPAGSLGDIGCTSFFPAKPLGCYGDGGAVFTDSDEIAKKLKSIRVHGKGADKYDNVRVGINGRIDTIQAAVLLAKLPIFPGEIQKRNTVARRYSELIARKGEVGLKFPFVPNGYASAWAQYSVVVENEADREEIQAKLKASGIPTAVYYQTPLHLQTAFRDLGYQAGDFPVSENLSRCIFSLPMHPYLTAEEQVRVVEVLMSGGLS
ncbi:aminotransferase class I/II-fold pyridoxal phosphate-dependent enzyme [Desulfobacter sp.]|uniref:aminotransferase class I/II-fold pyridoxal phosphate-dependent enzyme n=1 Tax=Desulfobacter sp. TaxID=2294 RepID=UPI003D150DD8